MKTSRELFLQAARVFIRYKRLSTMQRHTTTDVYPILEKMVERTNKRTMNERTNH